MFVCYATYFTIVFIRASQLDIPSVQCEVVIAIHFIPSALILLHSMTLYYVFSQWYVILQKQQQPNFPAGSIKVSY